MVDRSRRARVRTLGIAGAIAGAGLTVGLAVVAAHTAPGRPAPAGDQRAGSSDASQVFLLRPPGALPVATPAPPATTTGGS